MASFVRRISDRFLKPRYVKLIVPVSMLHAAAKIDGGGKISKACAEFAKVAEETRSLFYPTFWAEYRQLDDDTNGTESNDAEAA